MALCDDLQLDVLQREAIGQRLQEIHAVWVSLVLSGRAFTETVQVFHRFELTLNQIWTPEDVTIKFQ